MPINYRVSYLTYRSGAPVRVDENKPGGVSFTAYDIFDCKNLRRVTDPDEINEIQPQFLENK